MQRVFVFGLTTLALAGSVLAQPVSDHPSGVAIPYAAQSYGYGSAGAQDHGGNRGVYPQSSGPIGGPYLDPAPWREHSKPIPMSARNDVGLQCPADKVKLCASRTTELSAYRCLIFHRSKLSPACRHAVDELTPG